MAPRADRRDAGAAAGDPLEHRHQRGGARDTSGDVFSAALPADGPRLEPEALPGSRERVGATERGQASAGSGQSRAAQGPQVERRPDAETWSERLQALVDARSK